MAKIAEHPNTSYPITLKNFHEDAGTLFVNDDVAVNLVVQDYNSTEAWIQTKQWNTIWREADILYQSPRSISAWEGSTVTRANVTRFTVAKHVNSIVPQLTNGLLFNDPPFKTRPRPGSDEEDVRAWETILSTLLDIMDFQSTVPRAFRSQALFGTVISKWGECRETKIEKIYKRKATPESVSLPLGGKISIPTAESDEYEIQEVVKENWHPFLDVCDHRRVKVDPSLTVGDIRCAKFVIFEDYLNYYDLEKLRDDETYDLPDEETLKSYFDRPKEEPAPPSVPQQSNSAPPIQQAEQPNYPISADPLANYLQVLERVDSEGRIITVLNQKLCIRNTANDLGAINYLSSNWWDIPNSFWGMGIGRIIGQDQRVDQGVTNAALDVLSMKVNWTAFRQRGSNAPTQPIRARLGGIYDVDGPNGDPSKAMHILDFPDVPGEVWMALQNSRAEEESATGASEILVQGSMPTQGRTSMGRTATGAGNMQAASASRLQGPLDQFINQVFIPFLYQCDQMVRDRMPFSQIKDILGEKLGEEFVQKLDQDKFRNARMDYECLAGARLAAKRQMAQSLPLMFNLFGMPAVTQDLQMQGKKIKWETLVRRLEEMSEWRDSESLVEDMTPEEKQQAMSMQPGVQQIQGKMALNNQTFQQKQQLIDQENQARAANQVLRVIEERTMEAAPTGSKDGAPFE